MSVKPIPEGYQQVIPYLVVKDAAAQMDFLISVFDGTELERMLGPGGTVMHGEVKLGDSIIMIGQAMDGQPSRSTMLYVYVEDCDSVYNKAIDQGAKSISELANQFYGDRHGGIEDSNGNHWYIATHKEDLSSEELQKRTSQLRG
jgi:PhnB protein